MCPVQIDTGLQGSLCMEWSNSRELLAIGGVLIENKNHGPQAQYTNMLKFYNERGILIYSTLIPYCQVSSWAWNDTRISFVLLQSPVTALTWGHNDKRLFLATGTQIHIAWVSRRIATLQLLSRLNIYNSIYQESQLSALALPPRIRNLIGNLFAQTIRVRGSKRHSK